MKKLFVFTCFLLALHAVKAQSAEQKAVQQAVAGVFDGLSAADMQVIKKNTTADFMVLENGVVWTMDTIVVKVAQLRSLPSYHRENHFDFIHVEVKGDMAWAAYRNSANIIMNEKNIAKQWLESAILVKEAGTWKMQLLHSTVISIPAGHP